VRDEDASALPPGWAMTRLNDLGTWSGGGTPSKANNAFWNNGTIPWVSPKDMKCGRIRTAEDFITEEAVDRSSAKYIPANSILMVTRSGILAHTFPVAVNECVVTVNQDLKSLTPFEIVEPDFLSWYLRAQNFQILKECAKHGTTVASIDTDRLKKVSVPVAPLNEQRRIVEKIETLFARLDQGEAALRHTQTLLARYRQSVLKAAVTGALTADWRAQNAHRLEHGRDLLARILQTRRETWQGRGKYQEPAAPDTSNLPELPEGWVWASVDQLSSSAPNSLCIGPFGSNLKVEDYRDTGVPLVFVRHIRAKNFEGQNSRFVTEEKAFELSSHRVFPGDLLITKMGDPPGDVCIYPENSPVAIITADCIRFAASTVGVSRDYLAGAIESRIVQAQIHALSKGVAQQKVTLAGFKRVAIPLPSTLEQNLSATVIEAEFRKAIELAAHVQTELTRSAALRQSILKDAFAGKLVPQDPTDEPAAELLARIRASRATPSGRVGKAQRAHAEPTIDDR
jgi:type I restriction enzyme S subunit